MEVDVMKRNLQKLGIGLGTEADAYSTYVNDQFGDVDLSQLGEHTEKGSHAKRGNLFDGEFMFRGQKMRYTNAIKSLDKNKKTKDPYAKFQDLLRYWLGEGVSPELFPEFPGHAMPLKNEITNEHEWYICTYCRKEISLAHVFSEEHCFKMGRSWEAFNKHNPLRDIAARGSQERGPWRRGYTKAITNTKKERALHVREVYDREEWFKVAQGFSKPMSCVGIRDAKPSRHMRKGEFGLKANPNITYRDGKML